MTHNKAAVDLIAARLATGLIHPGDPDTGRPPTPILLPGLSTTGIPPEMAEDFAQIAGLPTNDAPKLLAEAIVALIETELAGGSTIVTDADLAALQQAAATAPTGARILSVHCTCDTTQSDPLMQLAATNSDRIIVNGKALLTGLAQRNPDCPHAVNT
jgi:hypothetical protein